MTKKQSFLLLTLAFAFSCTTSASFCAANSGGGSDIPNIGDYTGIYKTDGTSAENAVVNIDSNVTNSVYGGYNTIALAKNNSINITAGTIGSYVYGGYSKTGSAIGNKVTISGGMVTNAKLYINIYGGCVSENTGGNVTSNIVEISGNAFLDGMAIGGSTMGISGDANNNSVVISGNAKVVKEVFGGSAEKGGQGNYNSVTINDSANIGGKIFGGSSTVDSATGNVVTINGGTLNGEIYAGNGQTGAYSNVLNINGGTLKGSDIFAGFSTSGKVTGNKTIMTGGLVMGHIYNALGRIESNSNLLFISGGEAQGNVMGAYSFGHAKENQVILLDAVKVAGNVVGGVVGENAYNTEANYVYVQNANIDGQIRGGEVNIGNAIGNKVIIQGGNVGSHVIGGVSITKGNVEYNSVYISDTNMNAIVRGGESGLGNATGNIAQVKNATVTFFQGGYTSSGNVVDNKAVITDGIVLNSAFGGWAGNGGTSNNNEVSVTNSEVKGWVEGAYSQGDANGNKAVVNNSKVTNSIIGGESNGQANNNTVIVNGSSSAGIYGGMGKTNASGNIVTVIDSSVKLNIYGGFTDAGDAINNTVNIIDLKNSKNLHIFGGESLTSAVFTGNTLNWSSKTTVAEVNSFEYYNFTITKDAVAGSTLLAIDGLVTTKLKNAKIKLVDIEQGAYQWKQGDKITLIEDLNNNIEMDATTQLIDGKITKGIKTYQYELSSDNNRVEAEFTLARAGDQSKSLSEARIASIGFINTAADLATGEALSNATAGGDKYDLFGAMNYSDNKYNSGSYADVKGSSFLLGFARNIDNANSKWTVGAFLESGNSSYETFNHSVDVGDVRSNGKNNYWGGGLMARNKQNSGMYYEGSLRFGRMSTDYNSNDIDTKYDVKSSYYGLHLGVGKIIPIKSKYELDLYGKYYWSHQNSATATIAGESFNFNAINSHRLRLGTRMNMLGDQDVKTYLGIAYEHEFSGNAGATYGDDTIAAPSIKGSTGIVEIGLIYRPNGKSAFSMDIGLNGYIGKRQGIGGGMKLNWCF